MANEVTIIIKGQDQASSVLSGVQTQASGLGSQMGKLGGAVNGVGSAMQQAVIPAVAVGMAVNKVTQAALEDEASQTRLKQAVIANGESWDTYGKALEDTAKKGLDMGFADEATRESLALLVAQTGSSEEAMKRLAVAQDVARGTGMDLQLAAKLVGKVTDENVNVFGRYGIKLDKTMSSQEAIAAVQQKFGGQAQAYAESNAGAIESMRLKYGELEEQMGSALAPTLVKVTDLFTSLPAPMQTGVAAALSFGGAIGPLVPAVMALVPALVSLGAVMITPPLCIVAALVAVGVAIYIFRDQIADGLGKALDFAKELFGKIRDLIMGIPDFFKEHWKAIVQGALLILFPSAGGLFYIITHFEEVKDKVGEVVGGIAGFLKDHWQAIVQGALLILFPPGAGLFYIITHFGEVRDKVGEIVGQIVSGIEALPGRVLGFLGAWLDAGTRLAGSLVSGIKGGITDLIGAIPGMAGDLADAFMSLIRDGWNAMIDWADEHLSIHIGKSIFGQWVGIDWDPDLSIFRLAEGVRGFPGGLALVGERGPELVALPSGSDVYSNRESRGMLSGGGGDTYIINGGITIPAHDLQEMRDVQDFFARLRRTARAGA